MELLSGTLNTIGTFEVRNPGGIDNAGRVYGKSFYDSMITNILDTTNYFQVDKASGFKYQYCNYIQATNTTVTSITQADQSGSAMSYINNNTTVNQAGVSCTPLSITTPNTTNPSTMAR